MKRLASIGCALLLSACFRFDERLAACRNDAGAWLCGDAGGGGGGAGGGGGPALSYAGLQCFTDGGWCWEHPRPAGGRLNAVLALAPNDVSFGTEHGLVLHLEDAGWRSSFLGPYTAVTALCGRAGRSTIYAGANLQRTGSDSRVFAIADAVRPVPNTDDEVNAMVCTPELIWIAHNRGLWSLSWGGGNVTPAFTSSAPENVVGVTSTNDGGALTISGTSTGATYVNVRDQSGALLTTFTPDAAQELNFYPADIWTTRTGVVQLAFNGSTQGAVWELDAGGWTELYPNSAAPQPLFYDGAPWRNGALAVGSGGLILELEAGGTTERIVQSFGTNSYHEAVDGLPTGEAWVGGEPGCILARDPDGGAWRLLANCDRFVDFSVGREVVAVSADTLYRREPSGWVKVREGLSGATSVWTNPDGGGLALLRDNRLEYRGADLNSSFSAARDFEVLDEDRVVVLLDDGKAIDTNLKTGGDGGVGLLARGARLVVDGVGRTFWAVTQSDSSDVTTARLWSSSSPGEWTLVDAGAGIFPEDVATGFGRVWVVSQEVVSYRLPDGSWRNLNRSLAFSRVIVLDETRAWVGTYSGPGYLFDTTNDSSTEFDYLPFDATRHVVSGSDVWVLGANEGLIRRPVPSRP